MSMWTIGIQYIRDVVQMLLNLFVHVCAELQGTCLGPVEERHEKSS